MIKAGILRKTQEETQKATSRSIQNSERQMEESNAGRANDVVLGTPVYPNDPNTQPVNVTYITPENEAEIEEKSKQNYDSSINQAEQNLENEAQNIVDVDKNIKRYERWENRKALSRYLLLASLGAVVGTGKGMLNNIGSNSWKQYAARTGLSALMGAGLGTGLAYAGSKLLPESTWDLLGFNKLYNRFDPEPDKSNMKYMNQEAIRYRPENMR